MYRCSYAFVVLDCNNYANRFNTECAVRCRRLTKTKAYKVKALTKTGPLTDCQA